jgi:opacity protein-like surface antigen
VFPISLNLIYKLQSGGMLAPYFSGGVSYFMGSAKVNSVRGVGITWESEGSRFLDYLSVPLEIDESLSHLGFNLGAGLDILFSPGFGVNLDAAYFMGKSSDLTWQHAAGEYAGTYFPENSWTLDQDFVQLLDGQVSALDVNTSFFKIQAGVKVLF